MGSMAAARKNSHPILKSPKIESQLAMFVVECGLNACCFPLFVALLALGTVTNDESSVWADREPPPRRCPRRTLCRYSTPLLRRGKLVSHRRGGSELAKVVVLLNLGLRRYVQFASSGSTCARIVCVKGHFCVRQY